MGSACSSGNRKANVLQKFHEHGANINKFPNVSKRTSETPIISLQDSLKSQEKKSFVENLPHESPKFKQIPSKIQGFSAKQPNLKETPINININFNNLQENHRVFTEPTPKNLQIFENFNKTPTIMEISPRKAANSHDFSGVSIENVTKFRENARKIEESVELVGENPINSAKYLEIGENFKEKREFADFLQSNDNESQKTKKSVSSTLPPLRNTPDFKEKYPIFNKSQVIKVSTFAETRESVCKPNRFSEKIGGKVRVSQKKPESFLESEEKLRSSLESSKGNADLSIENVLKRNKLRICSNVMRFSYQNNEELLESEEKILKKGRSNLFDREIEKDFSSFFGQESEIFEEFSDFSDEKSVFSNKIAVMTRDFAKKIQESSKKCEKIKNLSGGNIINSGFVEKKMEKKPDYLQKNESIKKNSNQIINGNGRKSTNYYTKYKENMEDFSKNKDSERVFNVSYQKTVIVGENCEETEGVFVLKS